MIITPGIHGEPGSHLQPISTSRSLCSSLLQTLFSSTDPDRSFLPPINAKTPLILLINNLGSLPALELSIVVKDCYEILTQEMGLHCVHVLSGAWMTSLGMNGVSVTVLRVPDGE